MSRKPALHLDEARSQLLRSLENQWDSLALEKVLVIEDAFGRFSLGCWGQQTGELLLMELMKEIGPYKASLFWSPVEGEFDPLELEASWEDAVQFKQDVQEAFQDRIRLTVRHRMLPAWQQCREEPLWSLNSGRKCPVIAFYSFKGGMGRTTALAAFALDRARKNEHVVVVDLDLDAPGLGSVLTAPVPNSFGVVDYLLEVPILGVRPDDLLDYSWAVPLGAERTTGSLRVLSAGQVDRHYLGKMARLDFENPGMIPEPAYHPLEQLLLQIRDQFDPDWILLDSRTGFSEAAGMVLSGIGHFHVLLGLESVQSWEGLAYAVRKLGADRLLRGFAQAETMVVQGMVPDIPRPQRDDLLQRFAEHAKDCFVENYYAQEESEPDDQIWYLSDENGAAAPHYSWPLSYSAALSQSVQLGDLIGALESSKGFDEFFDALATRARGEGLQ